MRDFAVFDMHYYDSEWDAIQCCDIKRDARHSEWDALFLPEQNGLLICKQVVRSLKPTINIYLYKKKHLFLKSEKIF